MRIGAAVRVHNIVMRFWQPRGNKYVSSEVNTVDILILRTISEDEKANVRRIVLQATLFEEENTIVSAFI